MKLEIKKHHALRPLYLNQIDDNGYFLAKFEKGESKKWEEIVHRVNIHEELIEALRINLQDSEEQRDYWIREAESFDDNEKQMCIDNAREITERIKRTKLLIQKAIKQNNNKKIPLT